MKPKHIFLSTVTSCLVCLTGAPTLLAQQPTADDIDQQYLSDLYTILSEHSPGASALATQELSDADNIAAAQSSCSFLDNGTITLEGMISAFTEGLDVNSLAPEQQQALGEYLGAVIILGTVYYCPEHQETVQGMFAEEGIGQ